MVRKQMFVLCLTSMPYTTQHADSCTLGWVWGLCLSCTHGLNHPILPQPT